MSWAETVIALNRSLGTSTFAPLDEQIQETSLPAGCGTFNRTAFEYSAELNLPQTSDAYKEYVLAKFVAPETGTYKYTFDILSPRNYGGAVFHSASYLGVKGAYSTTNEKYQYTPELKFNEYIKCTIGAITEKFTSNIGTGKDTTYITFIYDPNVIPNIYSKCTVYFPANKGQAIILVTTNSKSYSYKYKNQKITY